MADEQSRPTMLTAVAVAAAVLLLGVAAIVLTGSDDDDAGSPPTSETDVGRQGDDDEDEPDKGRDEDRDDPADDPSPDDDEDDGGEDDDGEGTGRPGRRGASGGGGSTADLGTTRTTTPGSSTVTTLPLPTTTVPGNPTKPDQVKTASTLAAGDCVGVEDDESYVGTVTVTDCRKAHLSEVIGSYAWPATPGYPGSDEMTRQAYFDCQAQFERYVGIGFWESQYDIQSIVPSAASWDEGDREVTCLVVDIEGRRLTRSVRGTAT